MGNNRVNTSEGPGLTGDHQTDIPLKPRSFNPSPSRPLEFCVFFFLYYIVGFIHNNIYLVGAAFVWHIEKSCCSFKCIFGRYKPF